MLSLGMRRSKIKLSSRALWRGGRLEYAGDAGIGHSASFEVGSNDQSEEGAEAKRLRQKINPEDANEKLMTNIIRSQSQASHST